MSEERPTSRTRTALLYAGPLLVFLTIAMLPLIRGTETLILRDVLNSHFPMKQAQAEAMRSGYFPILDPYRAGGQPLAGNLNAAPFYPDNLLYLAGSTFWAFNAHFWLHLLLAPFAFYWMARAWGLGREASWAAAACWTASGYFLSHLNFYNLIAGVSLIPALVAAGLEFVRNGPRRGWLAVAIALLWTLLILGGDPQTAALSLLLAATAVALAWRERPAGSGWSGFFLLAGALLAGTLIALPQIVEFLRIFPVSLRGHAGYGWKAITTASWDPRQAAEWLLPFLFGRPDVLANGSFWGSQFFTGVPPYYLSLYPGLLALALIAASGRPRGRMAAWCWGAIAFGVFLSLGRFNPVSNWLFMLTKSLRYPVKFWLPVALGAALLCGLGFERLREGHRRNFRWTLLLLAVAFLVLWEFLTFAPRPAEAWLNLFIPRPAPFIANERLRWAGLAIFSLVILALLGIAFRISRRSWRIGGPLLIAVHVAAQLWLLQPLYPMDAVEPYLVPPPVLAWVPADLPVVHPDYNYIFGPSSLRQGRFPEAHTRWLERRSFYELYPFSGPLWKRRYELNTSPEGLDTYLARRAQIEVLRASNPDRLKMLAAWGVGRLLINHPIDPVPPHAKLLTTIPSFGRDLLVFEVIDRAPEAFLASRVFHEKDIPGLYRRLKDPGFDPRRDTVVIGQGPTGGTGTARIVQRGPETLEIETDAGPGGALLVVQRTNLLFKATIDGRPAHVGTANAYRIGVQVPAGKHRVRLFIDRGPLHRALFGALLGLLMLPGLAWWGRRAVSPPSGLN
ncbi:MAG: hypothetical protein ACJ75H_24055 [Thermoanaerobaculia bacterium]